MDGAALTRPLDLVFAAAMARLGPFGPAPLFAVGVSGGADSLALALLMQNYVRGDAAARGGAVLGLVVDHGLRAESAAEASLTVARLAARGIAARVLTLSGLAGGAELQARARTARFAALAAAVREAGAVFLALAHHAADQAETVAMRAARGDGGLEGMAGWTARDDVLVLRPLLGVAPEALRAFLRAEKMEWVEDPSNRDETFERVRVRLAGGGQAPADAAGRVAREREVGRFLADYVTLRPEGFALIRAEAMPARALGALMRAVAGADYPPDGAATAALAARLRAASLGGTLLARRETWGGWILAREPAACAAPAPALQGTVWDRRFRLEETMENAMIGALGADAAKFRRTSNLPSLVLRGLPCLRRGAELRFPINARFHPPAPVTGHPFAA